MAKMAKKEEKKSLSITDVAKKAGVSISTISRAMNDKNRLNPETYKKVQRVIRELRYRKTRRPPAPARPRMVAVVVPTILDPFFSVVLHGIETMAKTYTYNILLFDSCNSADIEMKNVTRILNSAPDGVIFVPSADSTTGHRMLRETGMPVVLLDRLIDKQDSSYVISNDEEGAYLATKYLIDLGHKSVLYVGGNSYTSTEKARLTGFRRALETHGLTVRPELVTECFFDAESSCAAMSKILREKEPAFTAIFAANDLIAFGVKKALEDRGLKVPQDVSLVGYGDMLPFSALLSLTSVSCPAFEMGKSALTLLIHIIEHKDISSRKIILRPSLVLRSSCRQVNGS